MVFISVILILLVALLAWILWTPVTLTIDTDLGRYELVQRGTFSTTFHPGETPRFRIRVMGLRFGTPRRQTDERVRAKRVAAKRSSGVRLKRSRRAWMMLLKGVYRSVTVRRLVVTADIDDVVLNAQLIPVMLMINRGPIRVSTNFEKRDFLCLVVQLRLNMLLWPVVRFFTKI